MIQLLLLAIQLINSQMIMSKINQHQKNKYNYLYKKKKNKKDNKSMIMQKKLQRRQQNIKKAQFRQKMKKKKEKSYQLGDYLVKSLIFN